MFVTVRGSCALLSFLFYGIHHHPFKKGVGAFWRQHLFLRPGYLHFFLNHRVVHFRGNEVTDGIDCDEYDNHNTIRCKYGCRGD